MASSNRHWPSMFKSKPCNTHHQWQHDINQSLISTACHRPSYASGTCEERSPEPKPRWNPKPEQIRILEAIFNAGMVNPPRDEIRKIRAQLQEYGQVGDANVFYWFQNRKSRSKHKLRHLPKTPKHPQPTPPSCSASTTATATVPPSEKSSNVSAADTELLGEPFFFHSNSAGAGFCFSELSNVVRVPEHAANSTGLLVSDIMNHPAGPGDASKELPKLIPKLDPTSHLNYTPSPSSALPSPMNHIQGLGVGEQEAVDPVSAAKSTVFINDVAFEVAAGPFNVREAFGDEAVLIHSSGLPVLTNDWGLTLHSLQHGAFYYLI